MTTDGWAMWQGAASLASGNGYTHFSGNPIVLWPPLYPLYLGAWTLVLGPTGWSLLAANGLLMMLQAVLWTRFALMLAQSVATPVRPGVAMLLGAFLGVFVTVHQRDVVAQHLLYVLLPLFLGAVWQLVSSTKDPQQSPRWAFLRAVGWGVLMALTHNAALAFIGAAALIVAWHPPRSLRSLAIAATIAGVPALAWGLVRLASGQANSHPMGLGAGKYGLLTYLVQLADGAGRLLSPTTASLQFVALLVLLAVALAIARGATGLRFGLAFVAAASVGTIAMFCVVWIYNSLASENYILFIPLVLLPLTFLASARAVPHLASAVLLLALVPQLYWTTIWAKRQLRGQETLSLSAETGSTGVLPPNAYLQRSYRDGPPQQTGTGLLVAPPSFEGRCTPATNHCY